MNTIRESKTPLPGDMLKRFQAKSAEDSIVSLKDMVELFGEKKIEWIDKKHLVGIYPLDKTILSDLLKKNPQLARSMNRLNNYSFALHYKKKISKVEGRNKILDADLTRLGIRPDKVRITDGIIINGIPVHVKVLRGAGINNRQWELICTHMDTPGF
jgi:hypothetical protein